MNTPRTEQEEAIYRIEWLIAHHAPADWRIVTADEVAEVKRELAAVTAERDALDVALDDIAMLLNSNGSIMLGLHQIVEDAKNRCGRYKTK